MTASKRATAVAAASTLVATFVVPIVLLVMHQNTNVRAGGALLVAVAEGLLVLAAAVLLILPVAWLAGGSISRRPTITAYVLGLAGSSAVAVASAPGGALFSIFLVVPAITIAALLSAVFGIRRR